MESNATVTALESTKTFIQLPKLLKSPVSNSRVSLIRWGGTEEEKATLLEIAELPEIWSQGYSFANGSASTVEELRQSISSRWSVQDYDLMVVLDGDIFAGVTGVLDWDLRYASAEDFSDPLLRSVQIGRTMFHPKYWGTGINKESKLILIDQIFSNEEVTDVCCRILETNVGSIRAIESFGFELSAISRRTDDPGFLQYSLLRDNWEKVYHQNLKRILAKK